MRHAWAYWWGQVRDVDNKQHHLTSVMWNAIAMMELEVTHPECDDRNSVNKRLPEGCTTREFEGDFVE